MIDQSVTLAYLHSDEVAHSFANSLVHLLLRDAGDKQYVTRGGCIAIRTMASAIPDSRNIVADQFLKRNTDWLFFVDADMGFAPDTVDRLLEAADPKERPIVGGLCFTWKEEFSDGLSGYRMTPYPTIYQYEPDGRTLQTASSYRRDTLEPTVVTGMACILIHRSVFETIRNDHGPVWFDRIECDDDSEFTTLYGEDFSFCLRARDQGFPIFVHTGVRTTHHKTIWVSETDMIRTLALQRMAEQELGLNGSKAVDAVVKAAPQ